MKLKARDENHEPSYQGFIILITYYLSLTSSH